MWVFTKHGFISAVCGRIERPGGKGRSYEVDPSVILLRARQRAHLEEILAEYASLFPDGVPPVKESATNDYRFRAVLPKSTFVLLMTALANDVDYGNFKSEVAARQGKSMYEQALHSIWSIMYRVQTAFSGPGIYDKPKKGTLREAHDPRAFEEDLGGVALADKDDVEFDDV